MDSVNIAYNLLKSAASSATVRRIVNMTAVTVVEASTPSSAEAPRGEEPSD